MSQSSAFELLVSLETFLNRRGFLQPNELYVPSTVDTRITTTSSNTTAMDSRKPKNKPRPSRIPVPTDAWKIFSMKVAPFLAMPPEVHLKIFEFLHPVEAVCLSVINQYMYNIAPNLNYPLLTGAPNSKHPHPHPSGSGCRHCCPVLFKPAHCELHFHLRPIIPSHLKFCSSCSLFTACQDGLVSDRKEYCGKCGISYRRRYERGRIHLNVDRPGEKQERLPIFYNDSMRSVVPKEDGAGKGDLIRMGQRWLD